MSRARLRPTGEDGSEYINASFVDVSELLCIVIVIYCYLLYSHILLLIIGSCVDFSITCIGVNAYQ